MFFIISLILIVIVSVGLSFLSLKKLHDKSDLDNAKKELFKEKIIYQSQDKSLEDKDHS